MMFSSAPCLYHSSEEEMDQEGVCEEGEARVMLNEIKVPSDSAIERLWDVLKKPV